jgi:Tol biopolymer transport system component
MIVGQTVGPYSIIAKLGEGGMGEVYSARDTRLNREVAIKILPEAFATDPDRVMRFTREAQTLASLNHPHIAQIFGIEETPAPDRAATRALIMELVPGDTLADRIARGPIPLDEAIPMARQVAEALEAAHDAGIVHRDLKPANIKLRPDGTVKVLDFGLAKIVDSAAGLPNPINSPTITSPAFTHAGIILGTAAYMAPEQARGRPVDKRADIWAFGCVLFEMLTGKPAFPGDTITDVIAAVVKNDPDFKLLPAGTAANVRRVLTRCLRKDPNTRLRDIGDARLDLVEGDGVEPTATAVARRSLLPLIAMALLAATAIAAAGWLWLRSPAPPAPLRWSAVLVGGPPTVMQPALSPDGQLLAFQTLVDGQSQVGVLKPGAGTWRVLTSDRTRGLAVIHDWATDGSRIYYDRQTDTLNGIFSVPALGGDERLVLENAGFPVVMPNGDLLFQRINAERQLQLHRFSPVTGAVEALPAVPDTGESDDAVVVSLDGKRVYFFGRPLEDSAARTGFYQLDLESRRVDPLTSVQLREPVSMAVNRENGDVYLGGRAGDAFQIVRMSAAVPAPEPVLTIPEMARFDVDRNGDLFVTLRARPSEIYAFPPALKGVAERLGTIPTMNIRRRQSIAPLPNGTFLVASRGSDHDRVLVVGPKRQPTTLVEGADDTRPPFAAIGAQQAVMMMGPAASPDIAFVNTADGRLVRRFHAPSADIGSLDASPDGRTLYYTYAGSVWSLPAEGGTPTKLGAGDSLTVEPETGDLIVKLDESARIRLVRMKPAGGAVADIPLHGELRLIQRALMPGSVRQGKLVLGVASADSWFWHAAVIDLTTGAVSKLTAVNPSDFHFATWRSDGVPIGFGFGLNTSLWQFTARP